MGCGAQGRGVLLPAAAAEGHVPVAAHDIDPDRRAALTATWPQVAVVSQLADLWDAGVDAVILALPGAEHASVAAACLEHGLHVLVEKPPGATRAEVVRLAETARTRQRVCAVGMNFRYCDGVTEIGQLLASSVYGTPVHVSIVHRSRKPVQPLWSGASLDESLFFAQGIHALDLARHLIGSIEIEAARSLGVTRGAATVASAVNADGVTCEVLYSSSSASFSHRVEVLTDTGCALTLDDLSTLVLREDADGATKQLGARTRWRRSPLATGYGPAGYGTELRAFFGTIEGDTSAPIATCDDLLAVYDLYNSIADALGHRRL